MGKLGNEILPIGLVAAPGFSAAPLSPGVYLPSYTKTNGR
jgi:hypothetical protein